MERRRPPRFKKPSPKFSKEAVRAELRRDERIALKNEIALLREARKAKKKAAQEECVIEAADDAFAREMAAHYGEEAPRRSPRARARSGGRAPERPPSPF